VCDDLCAATQTGNPADLVSKISPLIENKGLRKGLASKAKLHALNNFTIESHVNQLKRLYKSLI